MDTLEIIAIFIHNRIDGIADGIDYEREYTFVF